MDTTFCSRYAGRMTRTGRPPVTVPRVHTIRYRVTAVELAALTAAAGRCGQSVTDYVREMALIAAANGHVIAYADWPQALGRTTRSVKVP